MTSSCNNLCMMNPEANLPFHLYMTFNYSFFIMMKFIRTCIIYQFHTNPVRISTSTIYTWNAQVAHAYFVYFFFRNIYISYEVLEEFMYDTHDTRISYVVRIKSKRALSRNSHEIQLCSSGSKLPMNYKLGTNIVVWIPNEFHLNFQWTCRRALSYEIRFEGALGSIVILYRKMS